MRRIDSAPDTTAGLCCWETGSSIISLLFASLFQSHLSWWFFNVSDLLFLFLLTPACPVLRLQSCNRHNGDHRLEVDDPVPPSLSGRGLPRPRLRTMPALRPATQTPKTVVTAPHCHETLPGCKAGGQDGRTMRRAALFLPPPDPFKTRQGLELEGRKEGRKGGWDGGWLVGMWLADFNRQETFGCGPKVLSATIFL